jgi:GAF domain-containing protein/HAMP domain-containing protein
MAEDRSGGAGTADLPLIKRLLTAGAILGGLTVVLYLVLYFTSGAWQLLPDAGLLALGVLCLAPAWQLAKRGRLDGAAVLVFAAIIVAFGGGELAASGATAYNLIAVSLLIILSGSAIAPRRWWLWLAAVALFWLLTALINWLQPLSRYDIGQSPILRVHVPAVMGVMVLLTLWLVARTFRIGTIRTRMLISFAGLSMLLALILGAASALVLWQNGQNQVRNQLESAATLKGQQLDTWIDALQTDLTILLSTQETSDHAQVILQASPRFGSYEYARQQLLAHFESFMPQTGRFEELFIVDPQGKVLLSTNPSHEGNTEPDQDYTEEGLKGAHVSPPYYSQSLGQMTAVAALPLADSQGQAIGVLAGRANLETLNAIMMERQGLGQTGETYLVGPEHDLLTPNLRGEQNIAVESTGAGTALSSQANGSANYTNYRGVPVIGVYHWLPRLGVVLLAEQAQSETFRLIQTVLLTNLAVAVGALALALGVALIITRSIAGPLGRLAGASREIAAGNLTLSARVEREDEIGTLAQAFNQMTGQLRDLIGGLEQRVAERTAALEQRSSYLQASAQVGHAAASILDADQLIGQVVELIRERFDLYYVGLFLLDEAGEWAVLRAGTGEAGQAMLARGHRIHVGEAPSGMIGWAAAHGEARIALDVGQDAARLATAELPNTRSEAALPLRSRGRVVGALTVQSDQPAAFDQDTLTVLQTMADQVAVALDNARLFAESQGALEQAGRAYGEMSREAWGEMVRARPDLGFRSTEHGILPAGQVWRPEMEQAVQLGQTIQGGHGLENLPLAVPIKVRGDVVGVLDTQRPADAGPWSAEEVALLETVADQLGLALESARLYQDTQRRAAQERMIGEVTARMRETLDIEAVLKTATNELYQALDLDQIEIRLGMEE